MERLLQLLQVAAGGLQRQRWASSLHCVLRSGFHLLSMPLEGTQAAFLPSMLGEALQVSL